MRMMTPLHATLTPEKTSSFSIAPGSMTVSPRSPWHSPVPYLFGGLAAMLGLIAFALLILACSYWRLSRDNNDPQQESSEGGDLESGEKGDGVTKINGTPVFEEKIVVIMAGNDKPTFLATPALMIMSKSHSNDHLNRVATDNIIANNDESTSVGNDVDDEKPKEDETSHPHN